MAECLVFIHIPQENTIQESKKGWAYYNDNMTIKLPYFPQDYTYGAIAPMKNPYNEHL